ncbi:cupin domain-containing protein [Methyloligella sp. GL2]|nr:cupin domain-containing protein [Methyloligella sp. GL2]
MAADDVIALFQLEPHPEGGHFRETFRDHPESHPRAHSTAILFLLKKGESSRWHKVDAAEAWHWYGGGSLRLTIHEEGEAATIHLGPNWPLGEMPQAVVPAHAWQKAEPMGDWVLVGCTVAPGFDFEGFELAPEGWEPSR